MLSVDRRLRFCARLTVIAALCNPGSLPGQSPADAFDDHFALRTMRIDYFHTGGSGQEIVAVDRIVSDGPWAGSLTRLVDDTNLGAYMFQIVDPSTNRVLYSRGFGSIYGEWATTPESRTGFRTFHESLRFPWPRAPVQVVLKGRNVEGSFREIWSTIVDPASRLVNQADMTPEGRTWTVFENGSPTEKVDIVILGEGYTADEMDKFHADVRRLVGRLFATEPFRTRRTDFNVRAIDLPSGRTGVNRPRVGEFRRTPVSAEYDVFGSERYLLTLDNRRLRDVASAAPYEFVEILVNEKQYGGGGIFNVQATAAVDTHFSDYVFVHEFGHHFAGLADEYYTSSVAYETGGMEHPEPWEPNVTALHDPSNVKWGDLVEAATPVPTPWPKERFEAHARSVRERRAALIERGAAETEFDALFRSQREVEHQMLAGTEYSGRVGAFEGAMYESRGLYRPESDCIMFSRTDYFCAVCRRAIERVIELYAS